MEMGWDITKFYYWAYAQGAKNTFCQKNQQMSQSIQKQFDCPSSPPTQLSHSSLRSRILIYILQ